MAEKETPKRRDAMREVFRQVVRNIEAGGVLTLPGSGQMER